MTNIIRQIRNTVQEEKREWEQIKDCIRKCYSYHHSPIGAFRELILAEGGRIEEPEPLQEHEKFPQCSQNQWRNYVGPEAWQYKGRVIFPKGTVEERYAQGSGGYGYYRYTLPSGRVVGYYSGYDPMSPGYSRFHIF